MSGRTKGDKLTLSPYYDVLFRPSRISGRNFGIPESIAFYYKLSILPLILFIAAGVVFLNTLPANILLDYFWGSIGYVISLIAGHPFAQPSLAGMPLVIATAVIYLWIIFPLIALILSALLHIFMKKFLNVIKLGYSNTINAFILGISAGALLSWLIVLPIFSYYYLGLVYIMIIIAWSATVAIISLSRQQRIPRLLSLNGITALITFIILIAFLAVALFYAGNICTSPIIVNHGP